MGHLRLNIKFFQSFLLLVLTSLLLSACQVPFLSRRGAQTEQITLTYWGLWEPPELIQPLIDQYQATHPNITIKYEKQNPQQYLERLKSRIAAGAGPDIFRFHNTWTQVLQNELAPLPDSVMSKETYLKTFPGVFVNDLRIGNEIVGIPLEFDGLALYYNEDIFRSANITKPPATWDELRVTAAALTVRDQNGAIKIAGVALGTENNVDHFSDILGLMFYQNGVDFTKPLEKNGDKVSDALRYYTLFSATDPKNRVWDRNLPNSTVAFASGQVAMYFAPSWRVFEIKAANPSLNFKIAPVPTLPGEAGSTTWASYWAEGVSAQSQYQTEAWEFLRFLSTAETMRDFYAQAARVRLFGEPYSRLDLLSELIPDPYVGAYAAGANKARSWYLASATHDDGINDQNIKALAEAVRQINAGSDAGAVVKKLSTEIEKNLDLAGIRRAGI